MRRREFVLALGGVATWPLGARAQERERPKRIGLLVPERDSEAEAQVAAFLEELQRLGWTNGANTQIEVRWSGGDAGRIGALAQGLIDWQPDVILSRTTALTAALLQRTRTVPIVFVIVSDPVGDGFVDSLARPGRNATGFTNVEASLAQGILVPAPSRWQRKRAPEHSAKHCGLANDWPTIHVNRMRTFALERHGKARKVVERAVHVEPVSAFNSLLTGKIQGISSNSDPYPGRR